MGRRNSPFSVSRIKFTEKQIIQTRLKPLERRRSGKAQGRRPPRLSLEHTRRGPAHHQHRRRQHLIQSSRRTIRSRAKTSRCCGSRAPAAICARARARIFRRSTRPTARAAKNLRRAQGQGAEVARPRTTWSASYIHTTFNLNPRAHLHRHAAAQFHPGEVRGPHASQRDHRHRRLSKIARSSPRKFSAARWNM